MRAAASPDPLSSNRPTFTQYLVVIAEGRGQTAKLNWRACSFELRFSKLLKVKLGWLLRFSTSRISARGITIALPRASPSWKCENSSPIEHRVLGSQCGSRSRRSTMNSLSAATLHVLPGRGDISISSLVKPLIGSIGQSTCRRLTA